MYGGQPAEDQRIYYFNTKELVGQKYGTASPVPFRVVDERAGIDIDVSVKCFGEYSLKLVDPVLFYTNVCGNFSDTYPVSMIEGQLKSELLSALQPAFSRFGDEKIRYSSVPAHTTELCNILNDVLSASWRETRGLEIGSIAVSSIKATDEDEAMLKKMGKEDKEDQLNCGCCGYDSCHDKAAAILKGYANIDMCLPLLMEKSRSLANNIVNNTPNGLIVLDEELNIGLINNTMCKLVGVPSPDTLINQHIASILDPSDFFEVLEGKQIFAKSEYLKEYEKYVVKTISYDRKFKVLVCVFRDITSEEENKHNHQELVKNTISITDSLLEKNMRSVHEIASLLGETTAETKVALEKLKSLVKSDE